MQPKERVGDVVVASNNIDQIITMVKRHYKKTNNEKRGKREIREIQHIFRGTLHEFPEFIEKKKRQESKKKLQSQQTGKSNGPGSLYSRTLR